METFYFVCLVCTNGSMDQWTHGPMGAAHQAGSIPHICNFWYPTIFGILVGVLDVLVGIFGVFVGVFF